MISQWTALSVLTRISESDRWNFHHFPYGRMLFDAVLEKKPKVIVELGTGRGWSACCMALGLQVLGGGIVLTYDAGPGPLEAVEHRESGGYADNVVQDNLIDAGVAPLICRRVKLYQEWLRKPDQFDLLYVDIDNDGDKLEQVIDGVADQLRAGSMLLFEGGTEERDNVAWMKSKNRRPIMSLLKRFNYEILCLRRPGLSRFTGWK